MSSSGSGPTHTEEAVRSFAGSWPAPESPLAALLPIVYVAWSDGQLEADELRALLGRIVESGCLDAPDIAAIERWLDPDRPPRPSNLADLKAHIAQLAHHGMESPPSLATLGQQLTRPHPDGAPGPWSDPSSAAALADIEALLGVHGTGAVRSILGDGPGASGTSSDRTESTATARALHHVLDGDRSELRREVLDLIQGDAFAVPFGTPTAAYRERVLELLRVVADRGLGSVAFPREHGGRADVEGSLVVFETLAYGDLSLLVKFGVQFGLFGGSILNLGTAKHHAKYLPDVGTLDLPGCYGMSETRHGSNVRDVETTARYDVETGEFVIHTPHPLARKDWLGNAAEHGQMATVFAQLEVDGESHGVHAFLVPIRDGGRVLGGVSIEDCGHKLGLNGVDNGRISFDQVRIPRDNLLDRFAQVSPEGEYASPIASEGRRFFTMLGTLVAGRVSIAAASLSAAKKGLAVAVRYSDRRRQFGPEAGPEVPVLDYVTQQRVLLPRLATTYALDFAVKDLIGRYGAAKQAEVDALAGGASPEHKSSPDQRELEVVAAGLKAFSSWHTIDTLQAAREACGGKGYLSENLFGRLKQDTDVFATFEGANVVLLQLVAKGLLTQYRREMGDLQFWGIVRYIAEVATRRLTELNPVTVRKHDDEHLLDPSFHFSAFSYREDRLLGTVARRLKERIDQGVDPFDAMNQCQDHLVTLALAHVDRLILERFQEGVRKAAADGIDDAPMDALTSMYRLYALATLERSRAWYLEAGYFEPAKSKAIRTMVNRLCAEIRPHATMLVDAFGIPDSLLGPAAFVEEWES